MIKLFASDLDGTLLNKDHALDDLIESRIDQILEAGCWFSVATGRDPYSLPIEFKREGAYRICMNGALILDWNDQAISSQPLNKEIVHKLAENFPDTNFVFMTQKGKMTTRSQEEVLTRIQNSDAWKDNPNPDIAKTFMKGYLFEMDTEEIVTNEIFKIDAHECTPEEREAIQFFLNQHTDSIINAPSYSHMVELTHPYATKGQAITRLTQQLNIGNEHVAVYGDGWNDVDMLKRFSNSFVPCSAPLEIQNFASKVIGDANQYSVSEHMLSLLK